MTMPEICRRERSAMAMRKLCGYDQHDAHILCLMLHELKLWGDCHPIRIAALAPEATDG
jgi:hypothetical protein